MPAYVYFIFSCVYRLSFFLCSPFIIVCGVRRVTLFILGSLCYLYAVKSLVCKFSA